MFVLGFLQIILFNFRIKGTLDIHVKDFEDILYIDLLINQVVHNYLIEKEDN